ncbi:MAG: Lrp/AsnC family transcriptional regulator [Alphaproteobacteria bacterium]|jgi:Lrp/AsnC family leucine-responsive transcriptional regulator
METSLDPTDRELLSIVQEDARLSFREVGRRIGMSTPAVAERIRKLENAGVITGYSARVERSVLGQDIGAFLRLTASDLDFRRVTGLCGSLDAVVECHHVTGDDSFFIRVAVHSIAELEDVISRFRKIGDVRSSLVLSSPVDGKPVRPVARPDKLRHG